MSESTDDYIAMLVYLHSIVSRDLYRALFMLITLSKAICGYDQSITKRVKVGDTIIIYCDGKKLGISSPKHIREMYIIKENYGVVVRFNKKGMIKREPEEGTWRFRGDGLANTDDNSQTANLSVKLQDATEANEGIYSCLISFDDTVSKSVKEKEEVIMVLFVGEKDSGKVITFHIIITTIIVSITLSVLIAVCILMALPRKYIDDTEGESDNLEDLLDDFIDDELDSVLFGEVTNDFRFSKALRMDSVGTGPSSSTEPGPSESNYSENS